MSLILLFVAPWLVYCTSPIPPPCTCFDGTEVPLGEQVWVTPCRGCYCDESTHTAVSTIIMCSYVPCVDSQHDPEKCCPSCPNGENCRADFIDDNGEKRSEIILASDGVAEFGSIKCQCDNSQLYHGGGPTAYCTPKLGAIEESPVLLLKP